VASEAYAYHLDLQEVARIWRGGCIIRAALLQDIRTAYGNEPELTNPLFDEAIAAKVQAHDGDLRHIVCVAAELGVPTPGLMTALAYLDAFTSDWLPANLIQAQRDYFGAHSYERVDMKGTFHTRWEVDEAKR
jgi:6-phosphogluconate dehydrogenase